ncbi:hypothetical protein Tco_0333006 [Tanacetum coccineum]
MTTLQFADTHNMVAFLSKPAKSEGFEQIVDFLNANPIKYALTINPTIYTSCIEQFWATVKAKTVNEEVQLQALMRLSMRRWMTVWKGLPTPTTANSLDAEQKGYQEWVVETEVSSKRCKTLSVDEVTLAQALAALKSAKPKTDKVMLQEPEQGTITTIIAATTITAANTRPKAKGLVIHEEEQATTPTVSSQKPLQVKVQDKAEFNEDERLAREKDEANVALTKEWNDIQAKIDADYQLAQILQA